MTPDEIQQHRIEELEKALHDTAFICGKLRAEKLRLQDQLSTSSARIAKLEKELERYTDHDLPMYPTLKKTK